MNISQSENQVLFNEDGAIFMSASRSSDNCIIGIFGVPYDGTTSFRPGSRFGPSAIREVSNSIETYCPKLDIDLENIKYKDFGSLEINHGAPEPVILRVELATKELIKQGLKPLILGGEHSITTGSIAALSEYKPELIIIQLDAHADLREEWLGSRNNHACAMRRCLEVLPSKTIFQLAIRSGTKKEFSELKKEKRLIPHHQGQPAKELEEALKNFKDAPIYLTIDLDWFDPSIMPGTGTPEPGGFFWQDFEAIIDVLKEYKIVGADIVELAPQLDNSGISAILAAKVTRSLLMLLSISDEYFQSSS